MSCVVVLVALLTGLNVGGSDQRVAGLNSGVRFGNTVSGNTALIRSSATVVDGCGRIVLFVALFVAYVVDGWPVLGVCQRPQVVCLGPLVRRWRLRHSYPFIIEGRGGWVIGLIVGALLAG